MKLNKKMKILMLAWRDMKNPLKGGAEIVTDIYLSGLSKLGHDVTLFSSKFPNSKQEETYNNYKIIRKGNKLTVYFHGLIYATKHQEHYDIIIDQVNTIPFFTPLTIKKEKRIAYFNQLCLNVWFYEMFFPLSFIGYISEVCYLKLYRNTRCITISESSKNDLIKYAWAKNNNILISKMQISFTSLNKPLKKESAFVFVGRLKKSKRVHDCIKALSLIENNNNNKTKLYIIGDGDERYKNQLKNLAENLNLTNNIIFLNDITNQQRNNLMAKCLAILVTSVREGWGLIVTEANANGTIAITYDVNGLRDSNITGFITKYNTPSALAEYMSLVINPNNKSTINKKNRDAIADAYNYHSDWEKQVGRLEEWMKIKA